MVGPDGVVLKRFKSIDAALDWFTSWQFDFYHREVRSTKDFIDACRSLEAIIGPDVEAELYRRVREEAGL